MELRFGDRIPLKIRGHELDLMRQKTLGCFWTSKYYPKPCPRFNLIADELEPDPDELLNVADMDQDQQDEISTRIRLANKARCEANRILALYDGNPELKKLLG